MPISGYAVGVKVPPLKDRYPLHLSSPQPIKLPGPPCDPCMENKMMSEMS